MSAFWTYTALRVALFVATTAVLFGIAVLVFDDIDVVLLVLAGAVLSSLLSWKLLAGPRQRFAAGVDARAARAAARFEERRAREDAESDASAEDRREP